MQHREKHKKKSKYECTNPTVTLIENFHTDNLQFLKDKERVHLNLFFCQYPHHLSSLTNTKESKYNNYWFYIC